ncbi:hypothetical protein [Cerasicoccus fimbriatus]|uniref:hypothetical protein n=1 Tax=Cerasicoccus fimbriatus TaxID=3014554 RepID=UPI0022B5B1E6|nr:hypothetical protein [Cerasicoccus sp. TK19100]
MPTNHSRSGDLDELEHDLEKLADKNERRGLILASTCAVMASLIPALAAMLMGFSLTGRSFTFWALSIIAGCILAFTIWYCLLLTLVPPRDHLKKMIHAIQYAGKHPNCVSSNLGGQEINIHLPEERIILTGPEAMLFRKHWTNAK